ncbi:MAG: methionyl-tRNA formyltransferase [Acidobacteria bacterium]|nr:methionyl-tRNA formyltransferase [Acidobacteriota bacterium]
MDLIFLGTPSFAVPSLERLLAAGHAVKLVVTQPDRPKGRGQALAIPAVKECALKHGLPVYQPERIRRPEAVQALAALPVEAMVVVGYGQIIPQSILDLAPLGIVNVHASLLPKYRGAAPVQWAIAGGETVTGVTTMRIDAGLDTGDILMRAETPIGPDENAVELGARLAEMGADLLVETLRGLKTIVPRKQDPALATHAPILTKEDGLIDWRQPAGAIHNRVRGLLPWPGAYTHFRGQILHLWRSGASPQPRSAPPGSLVREGKRLLAACGGGTALELLEVQLEGKKRLSAADFANGQRLTDNETLGEQRP